MQYSDIPIVILAGGAGHRMGGRCKCLLVLDEKTVLSHLLLRLQSQSRLILLNTNDSAALFDDFDLPIIPDLPPGDLGPLGGLLSAWTHLNQQGERPEYLMSVAGDTPFVPIDLLATLKRNMAAHCEVLCCVSDRAHYINALWSGAALDKLESFIKNGGRSVGAFIRSLNHCEQVFDITSIDPFFNINTPEQLAIAKTYLEN